MLLFLGKGMCEGCMGEIWQKDECLLGNSDCVIRVPSRIANLRANTDWPQFSSD